MRIIAGLYRRRLLHSLEGDSTRPMLDRMRETLFNILQGRIEGKVFADLYAGTGSVGIEALSRGSRQVFFVESAPMAWRVIERNLKDLGIGREASIERGDVGRVLPNIEADIYFLGPPYAADDAYETTLTALGQKECELVIAQHARRRGLAERYGNLQRTRIVKMGSNALTFFEPKQTLDQADAEDES